MLLRYLGKTKTNDMHVDANNICNITSRSFSACSLDISCFWRERFRKPTQRIPLKW